MIYVYNYQRALRVGRGTVLVKHIAAEQQGSALRDFDVLCHSRVGYAVRHDSEKSPARNVFQHVTCARCARVQAGLVLGKD